MTTRQVQVLKTKGTHEIGNLNSIKIRTLNYGALVSSTPIDNFTLVELGYNSDGERICNQLADVKNKSYLIASPEDRMLGEELVDFFNDIGERARIVFLDEGVRFDTSAFVKNTGVAEIKNGQVAHFDPATKKFLIQDAMSPTADYSNANKKFEVVLSEKDLDYTCGKPLVRLEVQ